MKKGVTFQEQIPEINHDEQPNCSSEKSDPYSIYISPERRRYIESIPVRHIHNSWRDPETLAEKWFGLW